MQESLHKTSIHILICQAVRCAIIALKEVIRQRHREDVYQKIVMSENENNMFGVSRIKALTESMAEPI